MDKYIKDLVKEEVKNALKGSSSAANLSHHRTSISAELQTPLVTSTVAVTTSTPSVASTVQHARG